ncbi:MAG: hypothetical protein KJ976_10520, partial [Proteobacteria bacterium]|nr:hypothetical protein [Pseudomonadota bacterium]
MNTIIRKFLRSVIARSGALCHCEEAEGRRSNPLRLLRAFGARNDTRAGLFHSLAMTYRIGVVPTVSIPAGLALQTRRVKKTMATRNNFTKLSLRGANEVSDEAILKKRLLRAFGARNDTRAGLFHSLAMTVVLMLTVAITAYAQENRILMTTSQQYQNMVPNASFEAWDSANTKPTDWTKILTPTLAQDGTVKRIGSNGLKITSDAGEASSEGASFAVTVEPRTTYTFSCYYYSAADNQAELEIDGNVTADLVTKTGASALASTSSTWKRYSATFTTVTDTQITIKLYAKVDAALAKAAYFDGVTLTEGYGVPAFAAHAITDTGDHTMYGGLTVEGTTNLNGDVNLGNLISDTITLTGTLKSPAAANVTITPGSGGITSISGDLDVGGTITAGSGNNVITTAAGLLDATKLTNTVSTDQYSAYSDLVAETKIADASTIVTSANYATYGDITGVTAGAGLTDGGTAGSVTLNVGAGTGISVTADAVGIADSGVTTTQILDGTIAAADIAAGAVLRAKLNELRPRT